MILGQRIAVVMPAYNAERTLARTVEETQSMEVVDEIIVVDDASRDETSKIARSLSGGVTLVVHPENRGYGGNQKTCYRTALERGADIVIMVHPDYQYTPRLVPAMASMIASGIYDAVLASRILGGSARSDGMPAWRYYNNRLLTLAQNLLMRSKLSEFHTGYRAFHAGALRRLPLERNSDDFVFDNQMLAQLLRGGFRLGEISCPTRYVADSSSIPFGRSVVYGLGCLRTGLEYRLANLGLGTPDYLAGVVPKDAAGTDVFPA